MKTPPKLDLGRATKTRGSALVVVMLVCTFTLILVGSYLRALSTQAKIANRATLQNEARNSAEGVAEYALAEMHRRTKAYPSFGKGTNPNLLNNFSLSTDNKNFVGANTGSNRIVLNSIAFKNSVLSDSPSQPIEISGDDPVNIDDGDKSTTPKTIRSMTVFAKATARDPLTNTYITSYISENIQIRDQTWFNYAMFYNMDIEFHAGPDFAVFGPVLTNQNAYVTAGSSGTLKFLSTLTAIKGIYRFNKYPGASGSTTHTGPVYMSYKSGLSSASGDIKEMKTTEDSRQTDFTAKATAKWLSFVRDGTFSTVKEFKPPGMRSYVPEDFSTTTVTDLRNNAYIMIEPQLSKVTTHTDPYTGINDYGQKTDIDPDTAAITLNPENLKFSALSGFTIQVKPPASIGEPPHWRLVCYQATDTSKYINSDNLPVRDGTTGLPIIDCIIDPFNDPDPITGIRSNYDDGEAGYVTAGAKMKAELKAGLLNAIVSIPYRDTAYVAGTTWGNGTNTANVLRPYNQSFDCLSAAEKALTYYPFYDRREGHKYVTSDTCEGMKGAMHVIQIDYVKLKALLNNEDLWKKPYGSAEYVYEPAARFTGIVYVQFPLAPFTGKTAKRFPTTVSGTDNTAGTMNDGDQIRPAQGSDKIAATPGYSVIAVNAKILPMMNGLDFATTTMANGDPIPDGFTLASNGAIYIAGHYNSDGLSTTGSSTLPDVANANTSQEFPSLIAGDSVTILSARANMAAFQTVQINSAQQKSGAGGFTEVSSAIISGIVPTQPGKDKIWSGGVHNQIRFLENWSGKTFLFRGTITCLFENEVMQGAYNEGNFSWYYDPPTRDSGYHQYLAQGRFPPGTPIKRTIRRMNLQDITKAVYDAGPTTPPKFN